jgi:zinc transporter ZupT
VSAVSVPRASAGSRARQALTALAALAFVVWTLAAVFTLIYWSGLFLWIAGALALGGFLWILKVYLRPRVQVSPKDE